VANGSQRRKSAFYSVLQKATKEKPQRLSDHCGYEKLRLFYVDNWRLIEAHKRAMLEQGFF